MNGNKKESEGLPNPLEPFQPKRPWPTPTPGVPYPDRKEDETKLLKQMLEKLDEIERRLERIEKLLTEKIGALP